MIDFAKAAQVETEAKEVLENIFSKQHDKLDRDTEVNKIKDPDVAKAVIKRLLDKMNEVKE